MYSLLKKAQQGDVASRDKFFQQNIGLVKSIARRFVGRGTEFDDLCQIGSIGLLKAINKFDIDSGFSFSTYAVPLIVGEIKRFLRDDGMIKVSRSLKELGAKAYKVREKLEKEGGEVSVSQIAQVVGVSVSELVPALEAVREVVSLNSSDEDGKEKIDCVVQPMLDLDKKIFIHNLLDGLTERERLLVKMRYFSGKTQSETAKVLGISQVQVSRCEKSILRKLREEAM